MGFRANPLSLPFIKDRTGWGPADHGRPFLKEGVLLSGAVLSSRREKLTPILRP